MAYPFHDCLYRNPHGRKHRNMRVSENMGTDPFTRDLHAPQQAVYVLPIQREPRIRGEYIAPVLVLGTQAVSLLPPPCKAFVVGIEPFQDMNGPHTQINGSVLVLGVPL